MRKKIPAILLPLCAAGAVLCSCALLPKEAEPLAPLLITNYDSAGYATYTVVKGDLQKTVSIDVSSAPSVTQSLSFAVAGRLITQLNVAKGDTVKTGDVLAVLDSSDIDGPLDSYNKQIADAVKQIDNLGAYYEIDREVAALTGNAEQTELNYERQVQSLEDNIQTLSIQRDYLVKKKADCSVVAGIDGIISYIGSFAVGDRSTSSFTAFTIKGNNGTSVLYATSTTASFLTPGMEVDVNVGAGANAQTYQAVVGTPESLDVSEPMKDAVYLGLEGSVTLPDNSYGKITIVTDERKDVVYVPTSTLNTVRDQSFVYMLDENGVRTVRNVTIGLQTPDGNTEITSGLSEGDIIIAGKDAS